MVLIKFDICCSSYRIQHWKSKTKIVYIQKIKIFPLACYYNNSVCIEKEPG